MKNEFEAWDKGNNRFVSPSNVAIDGEGVVFFCTEPLDIDGYITNVADIVILEYSGKHDRNGTKLYKGDIVKVELDEVNHRMQVEPLQEKTIFGVVVIRPSIGAALLVKKIIPKGVPGIEIGAILRIDQSQDIRIGHIYTSLELLKEDSEAKEK